MLYRYIERVSLLPKGHYILGGGGRDGGHYFRVYTVVIYYPKKFEIEHLSQSHFTICQYLMQFYPIYSPTCRQQLNRLFVWLLCLSSNLRLVPEQGLYIQILALNFVSLSSLLEQPIKNPLKDC